LGSELIPEILVFKDRTGCPEVIRDHSENVSLLLVDDSGGLPISNTLKNLRAFKNVFEFSSAFLPKIHHF